MVASGTMHLPVTRRSLHPMCYSTTLDREYKALERNYHRRMLEDSRHAYLHPDEIDEQPDGDRSIIYRTRQTAFARPYWPVISTDRPDVIDVYRWGFVPKHIRTEEEAKEYLKKYTPFNAISEEVATKATYKEAWAKGQRCLIPVTSFTEWQHCPIDGKKAVNKIPHTIRAKEGEVFSLGGIWQDTALGYRVYTILTTKANPLMEVIHNSKKRQPVIIPKDMEQFWLSPTLDLDHVMIMCEPLPEHAMIAEVELAA